MKLLPVGLAILALTRPALSGEVPRGRSPKCVCCAALAKDVSLRDKILVPDTERYDARLRSYYSANAAQTAWCMVLPTSTEDVSRIAKIVSRHQCPFGIRSGAHSAWKGSNGVEDGITVDFGHLNTTTYDEKTGIASIQPGADWESVFSSLDPHGVTAVGGRASVVGVGGFTTGGGYSFHTNSRGFACDAVTNFEIVLGNGTVVNANLKENPDLFKAQKGGSGNLGFVTRVDQLVVKTTALWAGLVEYPLEERDAVFNAYLTFSKNMHKDLASQNIVGMSWGNRGYVHRTILSNVEGRERPPAFNDYLAIRNTSSTLRLGTIAEMVPEFTGPTALGLYANWMSGQYRDDFRMMDFVDQKLREYGTMMNKLAPNATYDVLVQFQPITKSMVAHAAENGGNILGLERVVADGPTTNWLIALTCDTAETQEKLLPLALQYRDNIDRRATELGLNSDWRYLNYAWADQNPIATFGKENVEFLSGVAAEVDSAGVFQKLRTTGFKIPV
ncbi:FAD binding domain-containing protein [Colletotrichum musicola]|uniref:FAD binding domain-containing protein n=1 Tax=Colletotrichum musicola TaxID=2175873 RepID=A0A8H6KFD2_9PEZI|nr:FAD binding domain-containing protein [Colletotrichum musicola]